MKQKRSKVSEDAWPYTRVQTGGFFLFSGGPKCAWAKAQALLGGGGSGGMLPPGKFWKNGAKSCNFMHSGSKNRVIAAWSAHKKYTEIKKIKFVRLSGPCGRTGGFFRTPLGYGPGMVQVCYRLCKWDFASCTLNCLTEIHYHTIQHGRPFKFFNFKYLLYWWLFTFRRQFACWSKVATDRVDPIYKE